MKKRVLIVLTAVVMIVATMSTCAFAGGGQLVKIYNAAQGSGYIQIDPTKEGTTTGDIGGGTYSYENGVLTLKDVTLDINSSYSGIEVYNFDITIKIEGNCKFSVQNTSNDGILMDGGNLTLTGSGTLDIENFNYGIYSTNGDVTIDGATITVTNAKTNAIIAEKNNIIFNGASNVKATSLAEKDVAVYARNEIIFNLTEGGKVSASSPFVAFFVGSANTIVLGTNNAITLPTKGKIVEDTYNQYIADAEGNAAKEATVEYVAPTKGADTSDSSDIALFGIMGILALCGAGFVYKRREN